MSTDKSDNANPGDSIPSTGEQNPFAVSIPADFETQAQLQFKKLAYPEITLAEYVELEKQEFMRQAALASNPALKYQLALRTMSPCGNGDLEATLDQNEWQGAYGTFTPPTSGTLPGQTINFGTLTSGISSGAITLSTAHQTWVGAGVDPNVGIPTTAQGSSGAVRIGNAVNGYGCELLAKSFVVTPSVSAITFWYAVVLQNPPGHPPYAQPFFWVRVLDSVGNIVSGAFDFGNGSDILVADSTNPFFQVKSAGLVYKDWSCAQIDLSTQIGKQVTIEFVTGDCGFGGHWGYAYIDSFCGDCKGSPTGNIAYDCAGSTHCGSGKICFNYSLPTAKDPAGNPITGTVTITLSIYQNGTLLTQFTSPTLGSGTSFCFNINPTSILGMNSSLGGFDFTATAAFVIGSTPLGHIKVGTAPDGIKPGPNNDYQIVCETCADIRKDQEAYLSHQCGKKVNLLPRTNCDCPDPSNPGTGDCRCDCTEVKYPALKPCISVAWGDSNCDCMETDDVETLCVTVCNCYSNVTFNDLTIGKIRITDMFGNPVQALPDGTPSVQIIPSGPICFGEVGPCQGRNQPTCIARELVLYTRGAVGKNYLLSFEGVCFTVSHGYQAGECFIVKLCQD